MARGEGGEQSATTLLSVKAINAESKATTVRVLMNGPRRSDMEIKNRTHSNHGLGVKRVQFKHVAPASNATASFLPPPCIVV